MFLNIVTWLILIGVVWWFVKPDGKSARRPPTRPGPPPAAPPAPDRPNAPGTRAITHVEPMVDCAHCGVHVPTSEAMRDPAGRAFCSRDHLAAGPRRAR